MVTPGGDGPIVTIAIPTRNEATAIGRCLQAVLGQDFPLGRMQIVVSDGGSTDGTPDVAEQVLAASGARWRVLRNGQEATTSDNLNAALDAAAGAYLCRVDARSLIPGDYVGRCMEILSTRSEVVVCGGAQVATAPSSRAMPRGIARALNNRLAMGGARYRSGAASGPDTTVYLGAFRVADLRAAGGWDPILVSNQDFDLNTRMRAHGLVWYESDLPVRYFCRADLFSLLRQYHRFGRAKVFYWRHTGSRPLRRQLPLLLPVPAGVCGLMWIVCGDRRIRRTVAGSFASFAGLLAVDALGAQEKPTSSMDRLMGALAIGVVAVGWSSGVLREVVAG